MRNFDTITSMRNFVTQDSFSFSTCYQHGCGASKAMRSQLKAKAQTDTM